MNKHNKFIEKRLRDADKLKDINKKNPKINRIVKT